MNTPHYTPLRAMRKYRQLRKIGASRSAARWATEREFISLAPGTGPRPPVRHYGEAR